MKKLMVPIILLILTVGLVACGNTKENAQEVYQQALSASENMKSAEISIEINQEMKMPGNSTMVMESKLEGPMIAEPLAMHQKGTVSMSMKGENSTEQAPMKMDMEYYMVDNVMYTLDSLSGKWFKMDSSMIPLESLGTNQHNATEQLEMMEKYIDDLKFEEEGSEYIFKLTADGEGFKELTQQISDEYLSGNLTEQMGLVKDVLNNMEITDLYVEMVVDKETYDLKAYDMDMEMKLNLDGKEMSVVQQIKTDYKNINTIDTIEIPQEIKDNAMEAPAM